VRRAGTPFAGTESVSPATQQPGKPVTSHGRVRPAAPRAVITLQVRALGRWRTVRRARLSRRSTYAFSYRPAGVGGHLLRVVKAKSARHARGVSPLRLVTVAGRKSARSIGRAVAVRLGPVLVRAPAGAIKAGQTLSVTAGAAPGYPAPGALSVGGGQYTVSSSQGEPASPVTVTVSYDPGLLTAKDTPVVLHGSSVLRRWAPERTTVDAKAHNVTARLSAFSPIDVAGELTWLFGDLTGNRGDLPGHCAKSLPSWAPDARFPIGRNDALPLCASVRSDKHTLYLNMVNNRGYAQVVHVTNAKISVPQSSWGDSLEDTVGKAFARLESKTANSTFMIAPGDRVTLAIPRPPAQVAPRTVSIDAAAEGGTVLAALGWAFLNRAKQVVSLPADMLDCVVGYLYNNLASGPSAVSVLGQVRSCVSGAASLAGDGARIVAIREALEKVADVAIATDIWFAVADLRVDKLFPPHYDFDIPGTGTTDDSIHLGSTDYGTLPAGQVSVEQLTASGGTGPYTFHLYNADDSAVPSWVTLAPDGTLTINAPAGTSATVAFHVYAVDHTGRHSPFVRNAVVFATGSGGAAQLSFSHQHQMLGRAGSTTPEVDCVSSAFCLAIGTGGDVHFYNGSHWTSQFAVDNEEISSVSCATSAFCAGAEFDGIHTSSGSHWGNFYSTGTNQPRNISCPAVNHCVIAGVNSAGKTISLVLSGGKLSQPQLVKDNLDLLGIACASARFCLGVGESGNGRSVESDIFNGTSWSTPR
jgi:hypothetical protein